MSAYKHAGVALTPFQNVAVKNRARITRLKYQMSTIGGPVTSDVR